MLPRSLLKILILIFIVVFVIFGIACLTLGIYVLAKGGKTAEIQQLSQKAGADKLAVAFLCLGILIIATCVFGVVAIAVDSLIVSIVYAICLLACVIFTIIVTVMLFQGDHKLEEMVRSNLEEVWKNRKKPMVPGVKFSTMDGIQFALRCCGRTGPNDYGDEKVTLTCCKEKKWECTKEKAYKQGCVDKLDKILKTATPYIKHAGIGSVLFEFIGFLLAGVFATLIYSNV